MMYDYLRRFGDVARIAVRRRLSLGSVRRYQERRLRRVVEDACRYVPFYRRLFREAGLSPGDIRGLDDLPRVPMTSKKALKLAPPETWFDLRFDPARLIAFRTTGSTGIPFIIRRSAAEDFLFHCFRLRSLRSYGVRMRDRVMRARNGNLGHRPLSWRLVQAAGLFRQSVLDTSETPQQNAADLLRTRPDVLTGYNSTLAKLARIITLDHRTTVPLRMAVGGADMLTPLLRRQIQEAFQARIHDTYECQEIGFLAWECPDTGLYHVCDDNLIIEVLKDGRPAREGEPGEVVATSLHLRSMPFLRYQLEDIVTVGPSPCPCGLPFRTFRSIEAKKQDYFRLPGGDEFYPWAISLVVIDDAPWVQQFELVQERLDRMVLRAEARPEPTPEVMGRLAARIRPILGPGVEFVIEVVPEIRPTPGGKFWTRRSLVNTMY